EDADVYGRIEVWRYDDADRSFRFSELDLTQANPAARVHDDVEFCSGCHNVDPKVDDPRPNWASYPDWPGMFGSHDDFFPVGGAADVEAVLAAPGWTPPPK